jgi:hypothetical protein
MPAAEITAAPRFWGIVLRTPAKPPKYKFPLPELPFRGWVNPATGVKPHHLGL